MKIAILGSTGSIGKAALEVALSLPKVEIVSLAAKENDLLLQKQIDLFSPKKVFLWNEEKAKILRRKNPSLAVLSQKEGLEEIVLDPEVDLILFSMSGSYSLSAFFTALKAQKKVALANKELLVMGGELLEERFLAQIIPVDSEHSALFQCLQKEDKAKVHRLILTASGGPFFHKTKEELSKVTLEEALKHPTWNMGKKITVDSSTLMNKGLEVIEAHFLFQIPKEKIEVVIHPQSWVHSFVEMEDGSILAQISEPDMKLPIQYAFTYPDRVKTKRPFWDLTREKSVQFYPVDYDKFPCLKLALESLSKKRGASCFLNACNEVLVEKFLQKKIRWNDIAELLEKLISLQTPLDVISLQRIIALDSYARKQTETLIDSLCPSF